jgi:hypothetical protein
MTPLRPQRARKELDSCRVNPPPARSAATNYNIFILVLTVFSLLVMVALLLPLDEATIRLLTVYDY